MTLTADNVMDHAARALGFNPADPDIAYALSHIGDEAKPEGVLKPAEIKAAAKAIQDNPENWMASALNDDLFAPTPGILV